MGIPERKRMAAMDLLMLSGFQTEVFFWGGGSGRGGVVVGAYKKEYLVYWNLLFGSPVFTETSGSDSSLFILLLKCLGNSLYLEP